jgi:hypothetical protein
MFIMLQRMAISTKNHQIVKLIIIPISINMMNPNYLFTFIKTTKLAFIKHSSSKHRLSYSGKFGFPNRFISFINTMFAAIFSIPARRIIKYFITISAYMLNFRIIRSFFSYNFLKPLGLSNRFGDMPKTFSRAANGSFGAIWLNIKLFSTKFTFQGDHYAS